ncbi:hypothetical protein PISMIDRAFT_680650 [Pisolithus microcarpus 441]|uniref:Uncharacterized protein n=1 Tax=Pisolithus microcarpus 441 TaxID=765257 RepID=A0A0C9YBK0_9AGAM|nr:hypothetical protein PISMIDRAFT_680650 [Pisolithus microcarpus 441]
MGKRGRPSGGDHGCDEDRDQLQNDRRDLPTWLLLPGAPPIHGVDVTYGKARQNAFRLSLIVNSNTWTKWCTKGWSRLMKQPREKINEYLTSLTPEETFSRAMIL